MPADLRITINAEGWPDTPTALLERGARAVLDYEGVEDGEVSVTLLSDADIEKMNRDYLGKDRPTDVIAFSLGDDHPVGDVYLGRDQAARQADEVGVPLREELLRLTIHGVLHVMGHDHPEGPDRVDSPMFAVQERLVAAVLRG